MCRAILYFQRVTSHSIRLYCRVGPAFLERIAEPPKASGRAQFPGQKCILRPAGCHLSLSGHPWFLYLSSLFAASPIIRQRSVWRHTSRAVGKQGKRIPVDFYEACENVYEPLASAG